MPAKYWLLPLFALALLVFAAHGPARVDQEQFVVTYVEFLPAKQDRGEELLEPTGASRPQERGDQLHRQSRNPTTEPFCAARDLDERERSSGL